VTANIKESRRVTPKLASRAKCMKIGGIILRGGIDEKIPVKQAKYKK
jgi:hypothetical protein